VLVKFKLRKLQWGMCSKSTNQLTLTNSGDLCSSFRKSTSFRLTPSPNALIRSLTEWQGGLPITWYKSIGILTVPQLLPFTPIFLTANRQLASCPQKSVAFSSCCWAVHAASRWIYTSAVAGQSTTWKLLHNSVTNVGAIMMLTMSTSWTAKCMNFIRILHALGRKPFCQLHTSTTYYISNLFAYYDRFWTKQT
jgi:hypothetical protein